MTREFGDDPALFAQTQAQQRAHRQQYLDAVAQEEAAGHRAANELASAVELLHKLEQTLPSYQRAAESYEKLSSENLIGSLQAEEKRREVIEKAQDLESQRAAVASLQAALDQSRRRIELLKSTYDSELHATLIAALERTAQLEQDRVKLTFRQQHLELRAPQEGIVKELATTTIGAIVQPGTVLLTLVPNHELLLAEVAVENKDIGFVRPQQRVQLKLATYPFQKYGVVEGVVRTVMADAGATARDGTSAIEDANIGASLRFKALIELQQQVVDRGNERLPLTAGMQVSAEFIQSRRSVIAYLLSPVQKVVAEAGRER